MDMGMRTTGQVQAALANPRAYVGPSRASWFRAATGDPEVFDDTAGRPARVSLILPALNEAEGLEVVLPRIPDLVDDVIVVNGPSTDAPVGVVRRLRPDALIVQQQGRGKGNALKSGIAVADGDIIVTMDSDGSMRPEDIPAFIDRLHRGADFVKG